VDNHYKIYDTEDKDTLIGVSSHYFKLSDAKDVYRRSINNGKEDDSLLIEVRDENSNTLEAAITFGVEEGEQFALALLNICNSIKR